MAQYDEKVTVIGSYEPSISDAYKINLNPKIADTTVEKPKLSYSIAPKLFYAKYEVEPIQAAKVASDKTLDKLYKNYIRLGFGNYYTPYAEFYANSLRSKDYSLGVAFLHHSSSGHIKDYAFPGFSRNRFSIDGKKFYRKSLLQGDFKYQRDVNHYYGYMPVDSTEKSKKDLKQRYNLAETGIRYQSNNLDSNHLNYNFTLGHYYFGNIDKSTENNIRFTAELDKNLGLFKFTDNQTIGLYTDIDLYFDHDSLFDENSNIINFKPFISTSFDQYEIYLGLKATSYADSSSKFRIFPDINAKLTIIKDVLIVYAGITGDVEHTGLRTLCETNPFVKSIVPLSLTIDEFRFYGGFLSSLSKYIDFSANIASSNMSQMPFYVTDTSNHLGNEFTVIYDDVNMMNLHAELVFHKDKKWKCALKGNWNQYAPSTESEAWQKPGYDLWLSLGYNIQDKINLNCDIYAVGNSYAKTFDSATNVVPADISAYADFNLEVEYRYTKILSGFIRFNNIGASRYYRWYNYPLYRFNLLAGITYSF